MEERSSPAAITEAGTTVPDGAASPARPVVPLVVSGLVVSAAALIAALRLYLPQLIAIDPLDGDRFLLRLAGADQAEPVAEE